MRRKRTLSISDLSSVIAHYDNIASSHDNLLFISMLLTGFFSLMCLGEMAFPDDKKIQDWRKISRCHTVTSTIDKYSFELPFHKADRFFAGNTILITWGESHINSVQRSQLYLTSCDSLMPFHSALWLRADGTIPTQSFFMQHLHHFFQQRNRRPIYASRGCHFLSWERYTTFPHTSPRSLVIGHFSHIHLKEPHFAHWFDNIPQLKVHNFFIWLFNLFASPSPHIAFAHLYLFFFFHLSFIFSKFLCPCPFPYLPKKIFKKKTPLLCLQKQYIVLWSFGGHQLQNCCPVDR